MTCRRLAVPLCLLAAGTVCAQWAPRYTIDLSGAQSRITLKRINSVNGDAIPDLLIGLPSTGTVLICSGRNGAEISRITIPASNTGHSIAVVPSLDNDPNDEFLVGDPASDIVTLWSPRPGNVNVLLAAWSPQSFPIGSTGYGAAVAAKDLDGDGRAELLVGAPGANNYSGAVEVFRVPAGSTTPQWIRTLNGNVGDMFGMSLTTIGDQNNDGISEVVVGLPRSFGMTLPAPAGSVQVFSGALLTSSTPIASPIATMTGLTNNDQFGWTVAAVGDQDADSREDLAIGAPSDISPASSIVRLFKFGLLPSGMLQPQLVYDVLPFGREAVGKGLAACEDYDGNGVTDFLVGVTYDPNDPFFASRHGYVSILNTPRTISMGASAGHTGYFGESVASLGLVLGRRLSVVADRGNGRVYVF